MAYKKPGGLKYTVYKNADDNQGPWRSVTENCTSHEILFLKKR